MVISYFLLAEGLTPLFSILLFCFGRVTVVSLYFLIVWERAPLILIPALPQIRCAAMNFITKHIYTRQDSNSTWGISFILYFEEFRTSFIKPKLHEKVTDKMTDLVTKLYGNNFLCLPEMQRSIRCKLHISSPVERFTLTNLISHWWNVIMQAYNETRQVLMPFLCLFTVCS